jgi:hypothetical protein
MIILSVLGMILIVLFSILLFLILLLLFIPFRYSASGEKYKEMTIDAKVKWLFGAAAFDYEDSIGDGLAAKGALNIIIFGIRKKISFKKQKTDKIKKVKKVKPEKTHKKKKMNTRDFLNRRSFNAVKAIINHIKQACYVP